MSEIDQVQRFEIAAHAASLGVWDWDLTTGAFFYSARAKEICGFQPDAEVTYEDVVAVTHPDDFPWTSELAKRAVDPAIRAREPYRYRIRRADTGEIRWVVAHGEPIFATVDGITTATRYIGTLQDVTDQRVAEQALIESEARLRFAIESGRMAVWEIDLDKNALTPSPELNVLCGFPPQATPTLADFRARYAPGEEARIDRESAEIAARGATEIQTSFKQLWPDGTEKWMLLRARVAPPSDAIANRVVGVIVDITAQKLAERRAELIASEMQHRVKNALAVVQTLAAQTFRNRSDLAGAAEAFLGRLRALAVATQSITEEGVVNEDVRALVEKIVAPYRSTALDPFHLEGPSIKLGRRGSTAAALALHELCTNAVKYGALSTPDGRVSIAWTAVDNRRVDLHWQESGGPVVTPPAHPGFGTKLLKSGLFDPDAVTLLYDPGGVRCAIRISLDA